MTRVPILLALVFVALTLVAAGFFLGRSYARSTMDSGAGPRFRLKEKMLILSSDGEPEGRLPAGTVMYVVPDPFGDRTSLFKVYLETSVDDSVPLERIPEKPEHRFELEKYGLRSEEWLFKLRSEDSARAPSP